MRLKVSFIYLIAFFISAYVPSAAAQSYTFKTIDDPNPVGSPPLTVAAGINDLGVIVGRFGRPPSSAFQYLDGDFSIINFPGACCGSEAMGINNSGTVVGDYNDEVIAHGYVLSNGNYTTLDFPGAGTTIPLAINSQGIIVGVHENGDFTVHGFIYNGAFSTSDCPAGGSAVTSINDLGDTVGNCSNSAFKTTAAGRITPISFPGASFTTVNSINNSGQILGAYCNPSDNIFNPFPCHGFVLFNGNYQTVDFPGSFSTLPATINNLGQIVGQYEDTSQVFHGFIATQAELVDPVPDLLSGAAVRPLNSPDDAQILATKGQVVQGVAADGVTEVVVRIPAVNVGDQFTLTIINDQTGQQSTSAGEDGALGNPGDTTFSQPQVAVTAVATTSDGNNPTPMAFAVYRAPIDFARPTSSGGYKSGSCNSTTGAETLHNFSTDDQSACRTVTILIQQGTPNFTTGPNQAVNVNLPVFILRPPVVLIHGLWGDPGDWRNFSPVFSNIGSPTADPRFYVGLITYNTPPALPIVSSTPDYSGLPAGQGAKVLGNAKGNSLGFQYNAGPVVEQMIQKVGDFKLGQNPMSIPMAAVQTDVVVHSMGGDIARTLPLVTSSISIVGTKNVDFFVNTFGQGSIHKLITIDTPHLGSTLATQLLNGQNGCVANAFALAGLPVFRSVQFSDNGARLSVPAAVGDLVDSPISNALQIIGAPGQHTLPTAYIAGTVNFSNLPLLTSNDTAFGLYTACGTIARNPLALALADWPSVFNDQANDAIVSLSSQLGGLTSPDPNSLFDGKIHSSGLLKLGFNGPSVLDSGPVPTQVINLLNTLVTNSVFHPINP